MWGRKPTKPQLWRPGFPGEHSMISLSLVLIVILILIYWCYWCSGVDAIVAGNASVTGGW